MTRQVEFLELPLNKLKEKQVLVGTPDRIRTCGPQLRRLMLYPTELLAQLELQNYEFFLNLQKKIVFLLNKLFVILY